MALFKPYRVNQESDLALLPIVEGQFIFVEDTQKLYIDTATARKSVGKNSLFYSYADIETLANTTFASAAERVQAVKDFIGQKTNITNEEFRTFVEENFINTQKEVYILGNRVSSCKALLPVSCEAQYSSTSANWLPRLTFLFFEPYNSWNYFCVLQFRFRSSMNNVTISFNTGINVDSNFLDNELGAFDELDNDFRYLQQQKINSFTVHGYTPSNVSQTNVKPLTGSTGDDNGIVVKGSSSGQTKYIKKYKIHLGELELHGTGLHMSTEDIKTCADYFYQNANNNYQWTLKRIMQKQTLLSTDDWVMYDSHRFYTDKFKTIIGDSAYDATDSSYPNRRVHCNVYNASHTVEKAPWGDNPLANYLGIDSEKRIWVSTSEEYTLATWQAFLDGLNNPMEIIFPAVTPTDELVTSTQLIKDLNYLKRGLYSVFKMDADRGISSYSYSTYGLKADQSLGLCIDLYPDGLIGSAEILKEHIEDETPIEIEIDTITPTYYTYSSMNLQTVTSLVFSGQCNFAFQDKFEMIGKKIKIVCNIDGFKETLLENDNSTGSRSYTIGPNASGSASGHDYLKINSPNNTTFGIPINSNSLLKQVNYGEILDLYGTGDPQIYLYNNGGSFDSKQATIENINNETVITLPGYGDIYRYNGHSFYASITGSDSLYTKDTIRVCNQSGNITYAIKDRASAKIKPWVTYKITIEDCQVNIAPANELMYHIASEPAYWTNSYYVMTLEYSSQDKNSLDFWNHLKAKNVFQTILLIDKSSDVEPILYVIPTQAVRGYGVTEPVTATFYGVYLSQQYDFTYSQGSTYTTVTKRRPVLNIKYTQDAIPELPTFAIDNKQFMYLDPTTNYSSYFSPTQNGHPATKKYVDDNAHRAATNALLGELKVRYDSSTSTLYIRNDSSNA